MKAAVVSAPGKIAVWNVLDPVIGDPYEAILKVEACAICNSTDVKLLEGKIRPCGFPFILGHEAIGRIVEAGSRARNLPAGTMVTDSYGKPRVKGLEQAWGGFAGYTVAKDVEAMRRDGVKVMNWMERMQIVPDDIDPVAATILCTLKEALSGLRNFGFKPGMDTLIIGDGPVSAALTMFAGLYGANKIVCAGRHDARLNIVSNLGAHRVINTGKQPLHSVLPDNGFDLVIDAVGSSRILTDALRMVRRGGIVGLYGVNTSGQIEAPLSKWPNNVRLHKLFFPEGQHLAHDEIIELIRSGRVDVKQFYSHVLPMSRIGEAFDLLRSRQAFKIIIKPDEKE